MKKKVGASHIEMILAFVLFAGVIGFALYFLNPVNPDRLTDVTMDYIYREVSKNVSVGVESFSVRVIDASPDVIAMNLSSDGNLGVRAEDVNGNKLNAKNDGDYIHIDNDSLNDDDFVFVKLSEDLVGDSLDDGSYNPSFYEIASSNYEEVFSEKRMLELNDSYYTRYSDLKDDFNIPDRIDFGFELIFNDSSINAEKKIPLSLEVFSESKRVEVLRQTGEIVFADFVVKLW